MLSHIFQKSPLELIVTKFAVWNLPVDLMDCAKYLVS